jgi:3-deoxy-manno-octulosonate cytidylyltransferase (CMP-KDO synthetase)
MSQLPVACVVPARMASSRFPGKPLAPILGVPMIVRVLRRAKAAECFQRILCATDSPEVLRVVEKAGFEGILTPENMYTGSDRVAWVASLLHLPLVVNLQGDEPVVGLPVLSGLSASLQSEPAAWITASTTPLPGQLESPHCVKVSCDSQGYAVEFTRKPPASGDKMDIHRGLYAYSLDSLEEFAALPPSAAEREHSLEQLRISGRRPIRVISDFQPAQSVDIPADIQRVEALIRSQPTLA